MRTPAPNPGSNAGGQRAHLHRMPTEPELVLTDDVELRELAVLSFSKTGERKADEHARTDVRTQ